MGHYWRKIFSAFHALTEPRIVSKGEVFDTPSTFRNRAGIMEIWRRTRAGAPVPVLCTVPSARPTEARCARCRLQAKAPNAIMGWTVFQPRREQWTRQRYQVAPPESLRSRPQLENVVDVEGVGHAFGQAERRHQSEGRARPQAGGHPASPVARRHELPVVDAGGQRMTS